jgi:undecaprenyl diphosphate synthase
VKVSIIGEREGLTDDIRGLLTEAETLTRRNTGLNLVIAFNYGSRDEIVRAVKSLARDVAAGLLDPSSISSELISANLDTASMPDPDLIIRTSGEMRLSNFLLWQAAYAEFLFMPGHWPDFRPADLDAAYEVFRQRERRFGGVEARSNLETSLEDCEEGSRAIGQ